MANKLYSTKDLLTKHMKLRDLVSAISKQTKLIRDEAVTIRENSEQAYAEMNLSKTEKRNLIKQHIQAGIGAKAKPAREKIVPMLREIEGLRISIELARDNLTNPIRRLNAITLLDPKLVSQRMAAMHVLEGMGPAELEVASEAAILSQDIGMLAAIVSKNNQMAAKDRPFTNADLLSDVTLPGQETIDNVYAEVVSLPVFALALDRSFDSLGEVSPSDRIAIGLAEKTVSLNEDGSLTSFETSDAPRYKVDGSEYLQPDVKTDDKVEPADFESFTEFLAAGGKATDMTEEDDERWFADSDEEDAA